jgi:hypothetical protein
MIEYRTKPLSSDVLLGELGFVCGELGRHGFAELLVSFGWDSNLPIDEMWKEQAVPSEGVVAYVQKSEHAGIVQIGNADIFVEAEAFRFTLCHEGDAHVSGAMPLASELVQRWAQLGYEPYAVEQDA